MKPCAWSLASLIMIFAFILSFGNRASADKFVGVGEYAMSIYDDQETAKIYAIESAKRNVSEKIGVYFEEYVKAKKLKIIDNESYSLLPEEFEILEQKFSQEIIDKDVIDINNQVEKQQDNYTKYDTYVNTTKHIIQLVTKDFRTYLLKNSIDYLNTILKRYSQELFSNEKDLIYITNDDSKLDIKLGNASYESLSGGEKTRVNIALLLAQKSLANVIGNMNCNIIISVFVF